MTAPTTPTETVVAEVWRDLLGLPEFDLANDFFQLGGHSMLAVQATYQLEERFGVMLDLAQFFALATVPEVAAEIDRLRAEGPATPTQAVAEGEL